LATYEGRPGVRVVYEDKPRGKRPRRAHRPPACHRHDRADPDSDFEYDIDDYDALLEPLLQRKAMFVLGSRSLGLDDWKVRKYDTTPIRGALLNFAQVMFAKTYNVLYQQRATDVNTMFKVFRSECLDGLDLHSNGFELDIELACKLARNGNSPMEVPVNYVARGFADGKEDPVLARRGAELLRALSLSLREVMLRNQRLWFAAAVAAMWAFFVVQAAHTPTLLDDWYQLTWHRHHDFGLSSIWQVRPLQLLPLQSRIGDVLLMIVNGPRWIHVLVTPLVQLALVPLAFIVAFGRIPKPTFRDLQLLIVLQLAIWLITPIPASCISIGRSRPNYLWSIATMLALFAAYRLDDGKKARVWLAPIMLVVGWCAGMGNEHTGPTAMLAMACLIYWKHRQGQLRLWMVAGAVGLFIGYPMLFLAPGQAQRYAGIATKNSPIKVLVERGVGGNAGSCSTSSPRPSCRSTS